MSTLPQDPKTAGPYLATLQSQLEAKQTRMNCLIIAHDDPAMVRRLSEVIDDNSAILQVPQSGWDFGNNDFFEAVTWSLAEAGAKHLVLVGHSQAGPPERLVTSSSDRLGRPDGSGSTPSSYDRLLDGTQCVQNQIQRSKDHFVEQLAPLAEIEEVRDALADGQVQLHTLFYMSESGTFLRYDIVHETFEPMGG